MAAGRSIYRGNMTAASSVTFNTPGTFTTPARLLRVDVQGQGAAGGSGNPGSGGTGGAAGAGNPGNSGNGGGGGGGSGADSEEDGQFQANFREATAGGNAASGPGTGGAKGESGINEAINSGTPGNGGSGGSAGSANPGGAGNPGGPGNGGSPGPSTTALGVTFSGGAGGSAGSGNPGNAGNPGSGGSGGAAGNAGGGGTFGYTVPFTSGCRTWPLVPGADILAPYPPAANCSNNSQFPGVSWPTFGGPAGNPGGTAGFGAQKGTFYWRAAPGLPLFGAGADVAVQPATVTTQWAGGPAGGTGPAAGGAGGRGAIGFEPEAGENTSFIAYYQSSGGGGGGGTSGNAGAPGSGGNPGTSNPGGAGSAATPSTSPNVVTTPQTNYPISVAPGGFVTVSWSSQ